MIKGEFLYLVVFFTVILSSVSCSGDKEQKVDQQYLKSQEYSVFKKNTNEELTRNKNSKNLSDYLVKFSNCRSVTNFEISFSLDWNTLEELSRKPGLCNIEEESQQIILLGEQKLERQTVRWFLLSHQSAYRDAEVIVATFSDKQLRSFNTVGIFEQIPVRNIQTDLTVTRKGNRIFIRSETIRDINYPLEQKNTITAEYEIDANGGIKEF